MFYIKITMSDKDNYEDAFKSDYQVQFKSNDKDEILNLTQNCLNGLTDYQRYGV